MQLGFLPVFVLGFVFSSFYKKRLMMSKKTNIQRVTQMGVHRLFISSVEIKTFRKIVGWPFFHHLKSEMR